MNFLRRFALLILPLLAFTCSFAQKNMTLRSNVPYSLLSNIWGHAINGKEYALVGAGNGLSIVDVTNPDVPAIKFHVPGPNSIWREVRTKGNYAYVVTEGGGGVTIVNLSYLPDSIKTKSYTGNGPIAGLSTIHALHIDGNRLYLYGTDMGGMLIIDITDPWNPFHLGTYNTYVHDGFVTNDTVYAGEIYAGHMAILDTRNPSSIQVIETQTTPGEFTHNTWMSTDRKTMYTTDEVASSFVTSYDISDLSNIRELDRYQRNPGSDAIVHNTYVLNNPSVTGHANDFVVTSYYTEGVVILDGTYPDNLVEVAHYDTSPLTGEGFNGAWGVYAFLPSGNLLISDIEEGMFVLSPQYTQAAFLEGSVRDSATNALLSGVKVELIEAGTEKITGISGMYKTGTADSGYYTVKVSKGGYKTLFFDSVLLDNGLVTTLDIKLPELQNFTLTGVVKRNTDNAPVPFAKVIFRNAELSYSVTADMNGQYVINPFYSGTYTAYIGKWGYQTLKIDSMPMDSSSNPKDIVLNTGYYDDFSMDFGWTTSSTAPRGLWEKGEPEGTILNNNPSNPETDVANDIGDECYVTGNGGGAAGSDDLDDGRVKLTSPVFDLTGYTNPYVHYYRWFVNGGGTGSPNDTLLVKLQSGASNGELEVVKASTPGNGSWVLRSYKVSNYVSPGSSMKIVFEAVDASPGHIVEAAVDKFFVTDGALGVNPVSAAAYLTVYPNPVADNGRIYYELISGSEASITVSDMLGRTVMHNVLKDKTGNIEIPADLQRGIYLVQVSDGTSSSVIRFVK